MFFRIHPSVLRQIRVRHIMAYATSNDTIEVFNSNVQNAATALQTHLSKTKSNPRTAASRLYIAEMQTPQFQEHFLYGEFNLLSLICNFIFF
jgi:hypothetical protein